MGAQGKYRGQTLRVIKRVGGERSSVAAFEKMNTNVFFALPLCQPDNGRFNGGDRLVREQLHVVFATEDLSWCKRRLGTPLSLTSHADYHSSSSRIIGLARSIAGNA